jgi:hypothetical protein
VNRASYARGSRRDGVTGPTDGGAGDGDGDGDGGREATARLLIGLSVVALAVSLLGIAVVWALTYGPL